MLNEMLLKVAMLGQALRARFEDEEGQGLVEYALILVLISVVAIVIMGAVGTNIVTVFTRIRDALVPTS